MKKETYVTDFFGKRIARLDVDEETGETTVSTPSGKVLGKATATGTSTFTGKMVSSGNDPELLVPKP